MRPSPIYKNERWNQMLEAAVLILLVIVILDMFFYEQIEHNKLLNVLLEIIELFLVIVVFLDLIIKLSYSPKKYSFLKRHAFGFIAALPFSFSMKTLKFLEMSRFIPKIAAFEFLLNLLSWERFVKVVVRARRLLR